VLARLRADPGGPLLLLPRLPTADVGPEQIAILAAHLTGAGDVVQSAAP
jgi:hypothetical protein